MPHRIASPSSSIVLLWDIKWVGFIYCVFIGIVKLFYKFSCSIIALAVLKLCGRCYDLRTLGGLETTGPWTINCWKTGCDLMCIDTWILGWCTSDVLHLRFEEELFAFVERSTSCRYLWNHSFSKKVFQVKKQWMQWLLTLSTNQVSNRNKVADGSFFKWYQKIKLWQDTSEIHKMLCRWYLLPNLGSLSKLQGLPFTHRFVNYWPTSYMDTGWK